MTGDVVAGDGCVMDREDDLRLARAAATGDVVARRELVLRLLDPVRNAARHILHGEADADDAAQSAMLDILRCIRDYRGDGPLTSWAARVAARVALARVRSRRKDERRSELFEEPTFPASSSPDASDGDFLLRRRLAECLDQMPPERRATVVLRVVHGLTLAEIAEETAVPLNTAKDRLRVGREELRRLVLEDPLLRDAVAGRLR